MKSSFLLLLFIIQVVSPSVNAKTNKQQESIAELEMNYKLLAKDVKFLEKQNNKSTANQSKYYEVQMDSLSRQYKIILESQQGKFKSILNNQQLKFESELNNQRWIFGLISASIGILLWGLSFLGVDKIKDKIAKEVEIYIKENHVEQTERIVNEIAISETFLLKVKALIDIESMNENDNDNESFDIEPLT